MAAFDFFFAASRRSVLLIPVLSHVQLDSEAWDPIRPDQDGQDAVRRELGLSQDGFRNSVLGCYAPSADRALSPAPRSDP